VAPELTALPMPGWITPPLAVFFGSALGGLCRHLLTTWVTPRFPAPLPLGTLIVNVSGALLIGLASTTPGLMAADPTHALLAIGFLGGYTTVSSFALGTLDLLQRRCRGLAALNFLGTFALCLAAVFAGAALGTMIGGTLPSADPSPHRSVP